MIAYFLIVSFMLGWIAHKVCARIDKKMTKDEIPSINPRLDAKCEMLKTIHDLKERLTKAAELLKWALRSDPEHDNLSDFDTKWKEAEQFLKEVEA